MGVGIATDFYLDPFTWPFIRDGWLYSNCMQRKYWRTLFFFTVNLVAQDRRLPKESKYEAVTNSAIHKAAGSLVTGCSQKSCQLEPPPEAIPPLMASGLEW